MKIRNKIIIGLSFLGALGSVSLGILGGNAWNQYKTPKDLSIYERYFGTGGIHSVGVQYEPRQADPAKISDVKAEVYVMIDNEKKEIYGFLSLLRQSEKDGKVFDDKGNNVFPSIFHLAEAAGLLDPHYRGIHDPPYPPSYSVSTLARNAKSIEMMLRIDTTNKLRETNEKNNEKIIRISLDDLEILKFSGYE